jgi:hypothetical protein
MALFTTALDLYGGVLWSGELQGFIVHEMKTCCDLIGFGIGIGIPTPHLLFPFPRTPTSHNAFPFPRTTARIPPH